MKYIILGYKPFIEKVILKNKYNISAIYIFVGRNRGHVYLPQPSKLLIVKKLKQFYGFSSLVSYFVVKYITLRLHLARNQICEGNIAYSPSMGNGLSVFSIHEQFIFLVEHLYFSFYNIQLSLF